MNCHKLFLYILCVSLDAGLVSSFPTTLRSQEATPPPLTYETLHAMTIDTVVSTPQYLNAATMLEAHDQEEAKWQLSVMLTSLEATNTRLDEIISKLRTLLSKEGDSDELRSYKNELDNVRKEQVSRIEKIKKLNLVIRTAK